MFLLIVGSAVPALPTEAMKATASGMTASGAISLFAIFAFGMLCVMGALAIYMALRLKPVVMLEEKIDKINEKQDTLMTKVKSGSELELMQKNAVLEHERNCMGNGMRQLAGSIDKMVAAFLQSDKNKNGE